VAAVATTAARPMPGSHAGAASDGLREARGERNAVVVTRSRIGCRAPVNQSNPADRYSCEEYHRGMPSIADPVSSSELSAFVATYEAGTVQGAADALNLTQSAVTKRLQALERKLQAAVFDRGRTGVTPTRLGQTIYPPAKEALAQLHAVARAAQATRAGDQQELRLSASLTIGEFLLPRWLSAFRAQEPSVHPQLEVVNSAGVLAAVRDGRSTIGFIESGAAPAGLESLVVARDELVAVVAGDHPWARRPSLSASALARESYLTRERDSGTRAVATAALAARGVVLEPALEVASTESLKRMIAQGGFSILSRLAIAEEQSAGVLVGLPVRDLALARELRAVRRRPGRDTGASHRSAAGRFWDWLRTQQAANEAAGATPPAPTPAA
jgi:DNA-binding transcriptional LysR family regulator